MPPPARSSHPRVRLGLRAGLIASSIALLAACGGSDGGGDSSSEVRQVDLRAIEYAFEADEAITIAAGDTIRFNVRNAGDIEHELEVLTSANRSLGKTERIPPGAVRDVTVTFEEAGVYRVICDIDDHLARGQQAKFDVVESS